MLRHLLVRGFEGAPAPLFPLRSMPTLSRIDWIIHQISIGRIARLHAASALDATRAKVKIVLEPPCKGMLSPVVANMLTAQLLSLKQHVCRAVAVDRGHHHSDGSAEICFWLSAPSSAAKQPSAEEQAQQCETQVTSECSHARRVHFNLAKTEVMDYEPGMECSASMEPSPSSSMQCPTSEPPAPQPFMPINPPQVSRRQLSRHASIHEDFPTLEATSAMARATAATRIQAMIRGSQLRRVTHVPRADACALIDDTIATCITKLRSHPDPRLKLSVQLLRDLRLTIPNDGLPVAQHRRLPARIHEAFDQAFHVRS